MNIGLTRADNAAPVPAAVCGRLSWSSYVLVEGALYDSRGSFLTANAQDSVLNFYRGFGIFRVAKDI